MAKGLITSSIPDRSKSGKKLTKEQKHRIAIALGLLPAADVPLPVVTRQAAKVTDYFRRKKARDSFGAQRNWY